MKSRLRSNLFVRLLEDRTVPATFTVLNLSDLGADTLRDCVNKANAAGGADTINFKSGLTGTITLTSGEMAISGPLTITGPGSSVITVSGNNASRIFNTQSAATGSAISVSGLTLTNATASSFGGAILAADENLTFDGCVFTANKSLTKSGGAIGMLGAGNLTARDCTFTNDVASTFAGAIVVAGFANTTLLQRCTISGNTAGSGGALYVYDNLIMESCTLSGNSATTGRGGAIYCNASGSITQCSLSGNAAATDGGAISLFIHVASESLTIRNSTITDNSAGTGSGGGIRRVSPDGAISIESSIISGNSNASAPDISSAGTVNMKTSAVGSGAGFTKTDQGGNLPFQPHANLKLGALANNGGAMLTHLPGTGSPLIDTGSNPAALITDQRGAGFPRVRGVAADMGAIEASLSFVVSNTSDSGPGSLRQAVLDANANIGADIVTFDPAVFATPQTIKLATGPLAINDAVMIVGPAAKVTIDGNAASRILDTSGAPAGSSIAIQNVELINGNSTNQGGALLITDEAVTLQGCRLALNTSADDGGAIAIGTSPASLVIEDCLLSNNVSTKGDGGAIAVFGNTPVTIRRSTLSGNTAADSGGALYFFSGGSLTVEDSTLSGNIANSANGKAGGGAVYFFGSTSKFLISNSTLSGNSAPSASGGAIVLPNFSGTAVIQNSTITNNLAGVNGGGIARTSGTGTVTLDSTIVSGNTNTNAPDLSFDTATDVAGNNNLIGVADASNFTLTGSGNQTGTKAAPLNAKLGQLANNGGPTLTHALLVGSPAVNKGNNAAGLTFDQRGSGFGRVLDGLADVGSVEGVTTIPNASAAAANVMLAGGTVHTITVQYVDDVGINTASLGNSDITVNGPGGPIPVTFSGFTGGGTTVTATYTMVPPGGAWDPGDSGAYSIGMIANEVFDTDTVPNSVPAGTIGSFLVAIAQTLVVNATNDESADSDSKLSLREAVQFANLLSETADTVTFDPVVFGSLQSITLTLGELAISGALTVIGPGSNLLTVSGDNVSRVFNTSPAPTGAAIVFQGLALSKGQVTTGVGGAILIDNEAVTLRSCVLTNSSGPEGGAISVSTAAGSLLIEDCTLSGNKSTVVNGDGGAINVASNSSITVRRSTLSGNTAVDSGGAIYFFSGGSLTIEDSTLSGNVANSTNAKTGGGAIYFFGTTSQFLISNSTISGNFAPTASGGGVCLSTFAGTASFQNSTITNNSAGVNGGGIARISGTGAVSLDSTIVSGNTNINAPDLSFDAASSIAGNNNLIGVADVINFTLTGSGNLTGTKAAPLDAKLGALADNGGPTFTHRPAPDSPAINAGNNNAGFASDQRGPGFPRVVGAAADMGAVELRVPPCVGAVVVNDGAAQRSRVTSIRVDFDQRVTLPVNPFIAFHLERQTDNALVGLSAAVSNDTVTHVTLTFTAGAIDTGPGIVAPFSLQDGRYRLTIFANQITGDGPLDGDCNGTGGDNFVLVSSGTTGVFRLFGDSDGDNDVDTTDFGAFRTVFGGTSSIFDFDNDGDVDTTDFGAFRARFGASV